MKTAHDGVRYANSALFGLARQPFQFVESGFVFGQAHYFRTVRRSTLRAVHLRTRSSAVDP
jgi:hypothetical protein